MSKYRRISQFLLIAFFTISLFLLNWGAYGQTPPDKVDESILKGLKWRCIGPANMGGRIDDFAVVENQPSIIYAATASAGVWKTINNGISWEPIFDDQNVSTIGAIAIAPSDPSILWVGTGEANNRQSSSWGDGVYKSTDAGKTWKNMGLKDTHHIGHIVIHSQNPDIVYVAALGHLWGANKERGLYKTTDGGKTWKNTLFIDENTGFVDVAMDPESPDTLYAAAYQRRRRGWGFNGGGPGSGLYKTTNGGETWTKLTEGLPTGNTGRIGISIYRSNPNIVYTIIEHKEGGVFRSEDKGLSWKKMSNTNPRPMYYSQIRIDPNNDQRIWVLGARMYVSEDGGKTFQTDVVTRVHSDHHALWINPADSKHMILGCDGGINISYDRGRGWDFISTLPLGQFYEIGFDMRKPYFIYGGLQDNGSWGGPSATRYRNGITNDDWFRVGGGDGFYTQVDPSDHNTVYAESQNGNLYRFDLKTGESKSISPLPEDRKKPFRFNWNSPIFISPHNPKTIYYGGNRLFKSTDRGDTWAASPDLTTQQEQHKLPVMDVLPSKDTLSLNDGIAFYGNIITISESPLKEGLLYVGTDDGNLQVSRDGGKTWKNVLDKVPGVPKYTYVSRVVVSRFEEARAYATFDGHRNDDFKPYVFVTENYGESWKSIASNLLEGGTVNVIREHHRNPNLLFAGTERGAYVSFNRGAHWNKIKSNFPIVPVDDIAIHPRENDLIFATHGLSIWILDNITPLEKLSKEILAADIHLFDIRPATIFNPYSNKGNLGHKSFAGKNPPFGAIITYYLKSKPEKEKEVKTTATIKKERPDKAVTTKKDGVKITILDQSGNIIRELDGTCEVGINRINWDLRYPPAVPIEEGQMPFRGPPRGPFALPGEYKVKLTVGDKEMTKIFQVEEDPLVDITPSDRKAQQEAVLKLNKLYASADAASKALDNIKKQIDNLKKNFKKLPDIPESITSSVEKITKEAEGIQEQIRGSRETRTRRITPLIRLISRLSSSINSYSGPPSPPQKEKIEEAEKELKPLIERVNNLINQAIPDLNKQMNQHNIPLLPPPSPIKIAG